MFLKPTIKINFNHLCVMMGLVLFFCLLSSSAFAAKPTPNAAPQVVSVTPSSGTVSINTPTNFISAYSDIDGWQNLAQVKLLINTSTNGAKCFYAYYDQNTNKIYLRNNTNKSWLGGYAPGSANIIQNSYVILDCSKSTIFGSGTTFSVTWSISFKPTFTGIKNLYLYVTDDRGAKKGWVNKGTCTIASAPQDTTPPTGTIKINNDAQYANSTSVTLLLSAVDNPGGSGLSQMQFSNDNIIWSAPEAYATSKSWTLSLEDGVKTVFAEFQDVAGNWSNPVSDTIIMDSTGPQAPTLNNVTSPTNINSQVISGSKSEDSTVIIVSCPTATVGTVSYPTSTNWSCNLTNLTVGNNNISVTARDAIGNESSSISKNIILDTIAPLKPQGLSANTTDNKVDLFWTANTETDLSGYNIYRSSDGTIYNKINTNLISLILYQDTGLTNGTTYYYKITALDTSGNESIYSDIVNVTPVIVNQESEPNNDFATADVINTGILYSGSINPLADKDYYKFTITGSGKVYVYLTNVPSNIDAYVFLYNSTKGMLTSAYSGGEGRGIVLEQELTTAGDYYVYVSDAGDNGFSSAPYTLNVVFKSFWIYDYYVYSALISPINADGFYDTTTIIASITALSNWTININDAVNNLKRTYTGTSAAISKIWDGKDESNNMAADGIYTYTIDAADPVTGSSAAQVSGTIEVDNTIPTGSITQPLANANLSGSVVVKGLANDVNFARWQLQYGQGTNPTSWSKIVSSSSPAVPDAEGNPPTIGTWDTKNLPSGDYVLRLMIRDGGVNYKYVNVPVVVYNVSIYRYSVNPAMVSPVNADGNYDTTTIIASITALSNWTINIKDAANNLKRIYTGTSAAISKIWDGRDESDNMVADGIYTYTIDATDPATGSSAAQVSGTIEVDNTIPTGSITQPLANANLSGSVVVKGLANDANFTWWQLQYGQGTNPTSWSKIVSSSSPAVPDAEGNPPTIGTWNTKTLPSGDYVLRLIIGDAGYNYQYVNVPVKIGNPGPDITELTVSPTPFTPDGIDPDLTNDLTNITFKLSDYGVINVSVYDSSANLINTLANNVLYPSPIDMKVTLQWNGRNSSGQLARNGEYKVLVSSEGGKEAYAFVTVNDMPIFNSSTVLPATFSPDGDGVNDTTTLSFKLSEDSKTTVEVYNTQNTLIKTVAVNTSATAGQIYNYIWDGKDDSSQLSPQGRYFFKVNATALTGSQANPLNMNVYLLSISDIHISKDILNPSIGENVSIIYLLTTDVKLSIKIYNAQNNLVRNLITNQLRSAGQHSETWDGRGDGGNILSDSQYYFTIEDSISGTPQLVYDPSGTGGQDISHSISFSATSFDTLKNIPSLLTYNLPKAAKINIKVRPAYYFGPAISVIKYQEPTGSGQHQAIWDGRDESGNIVPNQSYTFAVWGYTLEDNAFVIIGGRPAITQVTVTPIKYNPILNPYSPTAQTSTNISFSLSRDANVNMNIYDSNNILVRRLMDNAPKSSGVNSVTWDGKDSQGAFLPNGYYWIEIQAQKDGNYSDVVTAHIEVIY